MSALLADELVKAPVRHLRVVSGGATLGSSALKAEELSAVLAPVVPLHPVAIQPAPGVSEPIARMAAGARTKPSPIRLTRRGVLVVRAAIIAGVFALAVVAGIVAGLLLRPAAPASGESLVVGSGDTLWSIAAVAAAPGEDVRTVVAEIVALNGLSSETIHAGQSLILPAD